VDHWDDLLIWQERYQVEDWLEQIYQRGEVYWQQRSVERWILEGDANTAFFILMQMVEEGKQIYVS
jgi:hypothetical protein